MPLFGRNRNSSRGRGRPKKERRGRPKKETPRRPRIISDAKQRQMEKRNKEFDIETQQHKEEQERIRYSERPKIFKKLEEGWFRCANCNAKEYEFIYQDYVEMKGRRQKVISEQLKCYENIIKKFLQRNINGTPFKRPSEDTCVFCHFHADYKRDKTNTISTFKKFKKHLEETYGKPKKRKRKSEEY